MAARRDSKNSTIAVLDFLRRGKGGTITVASAAYCGPRAESLSAVIIGGDARLFFGAQLGQAQMRRFLLRFLFGTSLGRRHGDTL